MFHVLLLSVFLLKTITDERHSNQQSHPPRGPLFRGAARMCASPAGFSGESEVGNGSLDHIVVDRKDEPVSSLFLSLFFFFFLDRVAC